MRPETLSESLLEVAALVSGSAASWSASYFAIKRDERRLPEPLLARAYTPATLACSVCLFQQLAVLVHFLRTRRSFRGALLGLFWAALALAPALALDALFGAFLPG